MVFSKGKLPQSIGRFYHSPSLRLTVAGREKAWTLTRDVYDILSLLLSPFLETRVLSSHSFKRPKLLKTGAMLSPSSLSTHFSWEWLQVPVQSVQSCRGTIISVLFTGTSQWQYFSCHLFSCWPFLSYSQSFNSNLYSRILTDEKEIAGWTWYWATCSGCSGLRRSLAMWLPEVPSTLSHSVILWFRDVLSQSCNNSIFSCFDNYLVTFCCCCLVQCTK